MASYGSFADCKSRFAGRKLESVDAFIDTICIYKDCVRITEENALKGLPMVLDGLAATWWQGTKSSAQTWTGALESLRYAFGENKPNYRIFKELFAKEQGDREPTDLFVSNARALLSKLSTTPVLDDVHKIDMVRSMVPRNHIANFDELIKKGRSIEETCGDPKGKGNEPINSLEVLSSELEDGQNRALAHVTKAGKEGLVFVGCGAKQTIAGDVLYKYFSDNGLTSIKKPQMMTLADGKPKQVLTEIFRELNMANIPLHSQYLIQCPKNVDPTKINPEGFREFIPPNVNAMEVKGLTLKLSKNTCIWDLTVTLPGDAAAYYDPIKRYDLKAEIDKYKLSPCSALPFSKHDFHNTFAPGCEGKRINNVMLVAEKSQA